MAKGMSIKDAIKAFEEKKGVVATESEKVSAQPAAHRQAHTARRRGCACADTLRAPCSYAVQTASLTLLLRSCWHVPSMSIHLRARRAERTRQKSTAVCIPDLCQSPQVELYGMCPPIEKMDATLSTLKACK